MCNDDEYVRDCRIVTDLSTIDDIDDIVKQRLIRDCLDFIIPVTVGLSNR